MKTTLLFLGRKSMYFLLFMLFDIWVYSQTVTFSSIPKNEQLFPRDTVTNLANIIVSGTVTNSSSPYQRLQLNIYKNNILQQTQTQVLTYTNNVASFSFSTTIRAELSLYRFDVTGIKQDNSITMITSRNNIVAGDVFLINGQSNAHAQAYNGYSSALKSPFIKSFGNIGSVNDVNWYQAEGDFAGAGFIGQWGLKMANQLVNSTQIPLAIINQAQPGQPITYFKKDAANPTNVYTNYGQLLTRVINAGLRNNVRAIFYYQGEYDGSNALAHKNGYEALYNNWKIDYPGTERFYVNQVREGCGSPSLELRNYQRLFSTYLPRLTVNTSNGLRGHDGCHFSFVNGYEILGRNYARIVEMELYGLPLNKSYYPIDVESIVMNSPNQITINTKNTYDTLIWSTNAHTRFLLDNSTVTITGGKVSGSTIVLYLSKNIEDSSEVKRLSFNGYTGTANDWIYNTKGMSLFTFYQVPITFNFTFPAKDIGAGYALNFDGSNDLVEAPLALSQSYTKEAWIKLNGGGWNNIVSGNNNHALCAPNGSLRGGHNGAWTQVSDPEMLQNNIWYHVAITYNSATRTMKLYKNGILVSQNTNVPGFNTDIKTFIGAYAGSYVMNGIIDEVKIWNHERAVEQIRAGMCSKITNTGDPALLAYYRFDQFNSNVLQDIKGNNHGILKNFNIATCWKKSGAPIGDQSNANFTNAFQVSYGDLKIYNVTGNAKGLVIYYVNNSSYAGNPDGNIKPYYYGVFVCNPSVGITYTAEIKYPVDLFNDSVKFLYKSGGDDFTWKTLAYSNDTLQRVLTSQNQNMYHRQFAISGTNASAIQRSAEVYSFFNIDSADSNFLLYPNPASDNVLVSSETEISNAVWEVYNINGQLVDKLLLGNFKGIRHVALSGLLPGVYICYLKGDGYHKYQWLVVKQ